MSRRAPRLDHETYVARHMRRRGRFARIDPLKPRPLPGPSRVLGIVWWAGLLGYAGWKAWRRAGPVGRRAGDVPDSAGGRTSSASVAAG